MITDDLQDFVTFASNYLNEHSPSITQKEALLGRLAKLNEETGELNGAVLSHLGDQRKEKLDSHSSVDVAHEVADVIITALLIAKSLNIDVNSALAQKTEKIRERFSNGIR